MFYLVIVQNDSTPAIFSYASYDAALAAYHTELVIELKAEPVQSV